MNPRVRVARYGYGVVALAVALACFVGQARAENWSAWRGPRGDGSSLESGLPLKWSATEGVAWRTPIDGKGASTPVVWGDKVFITSNTGEFPVSKGPTMIGKVEAPIENDAAHGAKFFVRAYSTANGAEAWTQEVPGRLLTPTHRKHAMASPSCVADDERVYVWFGTGVLTAFDHAGTKIWSRDLAADYAPFAILYGHGSSPVLYNDKLILLCEHDIQSYILAVNKRTGETLYKADQEKRKSYSTPLLIQGPSRMEMVVNSNLRVDGFDPETGANLWKAGGLMPAEVPSPIFANGIIYTTGGFKNPPIMAVRPGGEGDVTPTHVVWRTASGAGYVPSPVWAGGAIFLVNDEGIAKRFDPATGENTWKERLAGSFSSSPVATADGRIYTMNDDGETFVLDATGPDFKVLANNPLGETSLASPAVSGGSIYLRTEKALYRIGPAVSGAAPEKSAPQPAP